jgi:aerobic-type carbon monoxide dehydrogenase small subunit (CoxS/CutS family)
MTNDYKSGKCRKESYLAEFCLRAPGFVSRSNRGQGLKASKEKEKGLTEGGFHQSNDNSRIKAVQLKKLLLDNRTGIRLHMQVECKSAIIWVKRGHDMNETISFKVNDKAVSLTTDGERKLLWVLRTDLGLTGTKYGCGKALCGACTVIVNDRAVRSCVVPVRSIKGKNVLTIEGLAKNGDLHPIQEAFVKHDALQCGFCTPGMILNAYSLLLRNPKPSREEIIRGMENNLCRCGAHKRIIEAIQSAAEEMKGVEQR